MRKKRSNSGNKDHCLERNKEEALEGKDGFIKEEDKLSKTRSQMMDKHL